MRMTADLARTTAQAVDGAHGPAQVALARLVGADDDRHDWRRARARFWMTEAIEMSCAPEDAGDPGQHAGPVDDHEAQVVLAVAGRPSASAAHARAAAPAGSRAARTRPRLPLRRLRATSIRSATTAVAVGIMPAPRPKYMLGAERLALHDDGVERAVDVGEQVLARHHGRVHRALRCRSPSRLAIASSLIDVAELAREGDVEPG